MDGASALLTSWQKYSNVFLEVFEAGIESFFFIIIEVFEAL